MFEASGHFQPGYLQVNYEDTLCTIKNAAVNLTHCILPCVLGLSESGLIGFRISSLRPPADSQIGF